MRKKFAPSHKGTLMTTSTQPLHTPEQRALFAAQRQLDAYNARDIEAFVAAYHPDVTLLDLKTSQPLGLGREELRSTYGELFAQTPNLHAAVVSRVVVGNVAFDREVVTGRQAGAPPLHAMAIYEVDDDALITRAWFVLA